MMGHSSALRVVAVDVETTGLSPTRDRLVEVAAVCAQDGVEDGVFEALVNPGRPIPWDALRIHGITDAMVRDCPPAGAVLPAFLDFCATADALVAHNARFDVAFLREECRRAGLPPLAMPVFDTCAIARRLMPGRASYSLEMLCASLGLSHGQSHRALQDARDCLAVFTHLQGLGFTAEKRLPEITPAQQAHIDLILVALERNARLVIEYRDGRGRVTEREILPRGWFPEDQLIEAYCYLRNETRHFHIERIRSIRQA
jgi:DNA polymerase III epsilon subunit family exonuclease